MTLNKLDWWKRHSKVWHDAYRQRSKVVEPSLTGMRDEIEHLKIMLGHSEYRNQELVEQLKKVRDNDKETVDPQNYLPDKILDNEKMIVNLNLENSKLNKSLDNEKWHSEEQRVRITQLQELHEGKIKEIENLKKSLASRDEEIENLRLKLSEYTQLRKENANLCEHINELQKQIDDEYILDNTPQDVEIILEESFTVREWLDLNLIATEEYITLKAIMNALMGDVSVSSTFKLEGPQKTNIQTQISLEGQRLAT